MRDSSDDRIKQLYQDYINDRRQGNIGKRAICLIDESGDSHPKHSSNLFVVSGIVFSHEEYKKVILSTKAFSRHHNRDIDKISLKRKTITEEQKLEFASLIGSYHYYTIHSIFDKEGVKNSRYSYLADPANYPQMYLVALRNVIERATWLAEQEKFDKVDFMFDQKGHISPTDVLDYSFAGSGRSLIYKSHLGNIKQIDKTHPALAIADFNASSIGKMDRINRYGVWDCQIANIINKGRFFSSDNPRYQGVLNNGIKLEGIKPEEFLSRYCSKNGSEIFTPISPQRVITPF